MRRAFTRLWGIVGVAATQLRRAPARTALAVVAVALAVLGTTLLASVGYGVVETGTQQFEETGRDLWITGGPLRFSPGSVTPIENTVTDSHRIADAIEDAYPDAVNSATPLAFHTVYVGTDVDDLRLLTGVGVPTAQGSLQLQRGEGFGFYDGDPHYANGTYTGPMTYEAIIDPRTATAFDVDVGETLYVGGSRGAAKNNAFTVVGISPTFSRFLGTPTVAIRLSELQEITGTAGADRATFIVVRLHDGADPAAIKAAIERDIPGYEVRTSREQLEGIVQQNAVVIAAGVVLVALAVLAGLALTVNLLGLVVSQQRRELAALRAIGLSSGTLAGIVGTQGLLLGLLGGGVGLLTTPLAVRLLNALSGWLVGFDSLVQTPPSVYLLGAAIAVAIGTLSAVAAGWQLTRLPPMTALQP